MKSKLNNLPDKEYFEGGYRQWGNDRIFEFERTKIKRGKGKRYSCTTYMYSKLKQCERCGKIAGKKLIAVAYFDLALSRLDYKCAIFGHFCLGCRNVLRALVKKIRDYKETEKTIGKLRRETNARIKDNGGLTQIPSTGNAGCA